MRSPRQPRVRKPIAAPPVPDWIPRTLAVTRGSQFGAILAEAMRCAEVLPQGETPTPPRFHGRALITSDGFLMCDFIDRHGNGHRGAFVGDVDDLKRNLIGMSAHLKLASDDTMALLRVIRAWIAVDYRALSHDLEAEVSAALLRRAS